MATIPPQNVDHLAPMMCPNCRGQLTWVTVRFGRSFDCPDCGSTLCIAASYSKFLGYLSLGASVLVSYAVGARGLVLVVASIGLFVPFAMLVSTVHRHLFPPVLMEVRTLPGVWTPLGGEYLGDVSHAPETGADDHYSPMLGSRPDTGDSLTRSAVLGIATLAMLVTVIALFVDGGAPSLAKWTLFVGCALLAWAGARVLPDVWDNRRDDKVAVLFVAGFVFLMLFGMWNIFTGEL